MDKYWVFCDGVEWGEAALSKEHSTFEEAAAEAKRRAKEKPDRDFYVLTVAGKYRGTVKIDERRVVQFVPDYTTEVRKKRKGK